MLERRIAGTFVELADMLVAGFDPHRFMLRCGEALGVDAVALLLAAPGGALDVVAAPTEQTRVLTLLGVRHAEGPGVDCYRNGRPSVCPDLADASATWPRFAHEAARAGFAAVYGMPLRRGDEVLGALTIFATTARYLGDEQLGVAKALAEFAAIGILQERGARRRETRIGQLQTALDSRVLTEQAKGMLAERLGISVGEAFGVLRNYSRTHGRLLRDVARAVVDNDPGVADLAPPSRARSHHSG